MNDTSNSSYPLLNPKLDFVFKSLFCHPDCEGALLEFLNILLAASDQPLLESVVIINPAIEREHLEKRAIVMDILAKAEHGQLINVEMSMQQNYDTLDRALFYWSKLFAGQLKRRETFAKLKPVISVFLLDYKVDEDEPYHSFHTLMETKRAKPTNNKMQIHVLELPKVTMDLLTRNEPLTREQKWLLFFKGVPTDIWSRLSEGEPMLRKVMMILEQMSMNERMREFARVRERGMRDYLSGIEHSYHEGKEEGKVEGIVEGVEKTARSMLSKGLPDLMIAEVTGLSLERIDHLKERS